MIRFLPWGLVAVSCVIVAARAVRRSARPARPAPAGPPAPAPAPRLALAPDPRPDPRPGAGEELAPADGQDAWW
jgi:hypothetical protein